MFPRFSGEYESPKRLAVKDGGVYHTAIRGYVKVDGVYQLFHRHPPVLQLGGTVNAVPEANRFHYDTLSYANLTIANGDKLVFDYGFLNNDPGGSIDGIFTAGGPTPTLRASSLVDQNGKMLHGNVNSGYAAGAFHTRIIDLSSQTGRMIENWAICLESDAVVGAPVSAYFRNIHIRDAQGAVKLWLFGNDASYVTNLLTWAPGGSVGYSNIVKQTLEGITI